MRKGIYLLETDAVGQTVWERYLSIGVDECEEAASVRETPDGGFVLLGQAGLCDVSLPPSALLVKTDSVGELEWNRTFSSAAGFAIRLTADGGYVLAGSRFRDAWLAKTDISGEIEWETFSGSRGFALVSLELTRDGGYVAAGLSRAPSRSGEMFLLKIDSSGAIEWERDFGGESCDEAVTFRPLSDGGFVILGNTQSFGPGPRNIQLIRTDETGQALWERTFGAAETWLYARDVELATDGGFLVAGLVTWSAAEERRDTCLLKVDGSGFFLWEKTIGGAGVQFTDVLASSGDGGFVLGGNDTAEGEPAGFVAVLRKLAPETPSASAFLRGDSTRDGVLDVSDAVRTLNWLFLGSVPLHCHDAADTDDDGTISLVDAIVLLDYLYRGGLAPRPPFPDAGLDPTTEDPLGCAR
jgi:hypothetical protein